MNGNSINRSGSCLVLSALFLTACGGGGSSTQTPSGTTPPPPPPPTVQQASAVTVTNQGSTGYWKDEVGTILEAGGLRLKDNGLTFDLEFTPDGGAFTLSSDGSCSGVDGDYVGTQTIQVSASAAGSVRCEITASSNNGDLWQYTLRFEDAVNPSGFLAPSSLLKLDESWSGDERGPDGACDSERFVPNDYTTHPSGGGASVHTASFVGFITNSNGDRLCLVEVFTFTDDSPDTRRLEYLVFREEILGNDGFFVRSGTGKSLLGPVTPFYVSVGDQYSGMANIGGYRVGEGGPGLGVGARSRNTGVSVVSQLETNVQLSVNSFAGGGNQIFSVEYSADATDDSLSVESIEANE